MNLITTPHDARRAKGFYQKANVLVDPPPLLDRPGPGSLVSRIWSSFRGIIGNPFGSSPWDSEPLINRGSPSKEPPPSQDQGIEPAANGAALPDNPPEPSKSQASARLNVLERPRAATFLERLRAAPLHDAQELTPIAEPGFCDRCKFCVGVVLRTGWTGHTLGSINRRGNYHSTISAVHESKEAGCQICGILALHLAHSNIIDDAQTEQTRMYGTFDITRFNSRVIDTWRMNLIIETATVPQRTLVDHSLWLHPSTLASNSNFKPSPHIEPSTGSKSSLEQVKEWLGMCERNHQGCKVRHRAGLLPTRLVEVLPDYERIVMTSDIPAARAEQVNYATLSHCWGNINMFTLCRNNLAELKAMIPHKQLTKSFQDAMDITRKLGLQYIWIDSLCIVQDDEDDWLREAALMSDIYGSSILTIAATGAADGNVGCYRERDPAAVTCQKLTVSDEDGEKTFDCYDFDIYKQGIVDSPLISRAWALQERFLTTRTIHFTSQQLIWECNEQLACETFPDAMPLPLSTHHSWFQKRRDNPHIWIDTVTQYSNCYLTHPEDKLIAISGIAKWLRDKTNDEYVVGLWRKDMEHQLLWCTEGKAANTHPQHYRAPSWSWASVDGPIRWPFWKGVSLDNSILVSHIIEVADPDPGFSNMWTKEWLQYHRLHVQCPRVRDLSISCILALPNLSRTEDQYQLIVSYDVSGRDEDHAKYKAIPVTIRAPRRGTQCLVAGLVVEFWSAGVYKRVGMFYIVERAETFSDEAPQLAKASTADDTGESESTEQDGIASETVILI